MSDVKLTNAQQRRLSREVKHSIECTLSPTVCGHKLADITNCVLCEKKLRADRDLFDVCPRCFPKLLKLQRILQVKRKD